MARTATPTTGWLLRGQDGRLTAYAPAANGLLRWTETAPGGPGWTGPERITVPGLEPHLSLCRTPQGYVYLFGVRTRETDDGRTETDVVYATQFQPGRALTPWRSIGTPYGQDQERAARIGAPAAVVDKNGPQVFLRNAGGGVCGRRQDAKGVWGAWTDMKGSNVLDSLATTVTEDGRAELLAPCDGSVQSWRQEEPGGPLKRVRNIPATPLAGSAACLDAGEGRVSHFWRDAADSALRVHTRAVGDPEDDVTPVPLGPSDDEGTGPVAALRITIDGHDCTVLAQRTASGLPAVAAYPTGDEKAGAFWSKTGEACVGAPAMALDALGRVVLAAFAPDGGLCVSRQKDEAGLALGRWVRV